MTEIGLHTYFFLKVLKDNISNIGGSKYGKD